MQKHLLRLGAAALILGIGVGLLSPSAPAAGKNLTENGEVLSVSPNESSMEEGDSSYRNSSDAIRFFFDSYCDANLLVPDYLEVTRHDVTTDETVTAEVAWEDFAAAQYVFSDETVTAFHVYEYTFKTYKLIDGEKQYGKSEYKPAPIEACNWRPLCSFRVVSKGDATSEYFDICFTSGRGNAPLVFNQKKMHGSIENRQVVQEGEYEGKTRYFSSDLILCAVSYDGDQWFDVEDNLYILLEENGTIYLRCKCRDEFLFRFAQDEMSFCLRLPYLSNPQGYGQCGEYELRQDTVSEGTDEKDLEMSLFQL